METTGFRLQAPPQVANLGVGVHGTVHRVDDFLLPDLWQLHLYRYEAVLEVDGARHTIRPGRVSLIPPGTPVRYRYQGRSEHLYAHLREPDPAAGGAPTTIPVMQDAGAQTPVLTDLLQAAVTSWAAAPARAAAEVWTALWRVAGLGRRSSSGTVRPHPAVEAAIAHVESHLAGPLTVQQVAAAAGVSHNHLTRLLREETGLTPVAYIRSRRMKRARHLLQESTLPITAVASAVGIPDLQAFNKTCRRTLGAPPRAVRGERATGDVRL
ncbi:AraC family transcriptional regulator [Streptomyces boninensis]|uniref:helix-turn-helix transcriptional regulator n=1 Tax=Streptomyces boninensis TaxID=2039455 RepID=UPI003B21BADB